MVAVVILLTPRYQAVVDMGQLGLLFLQLESDIG
jgi:hypothetical protein